MSQSYCLQLMSGLTLVGRAKWSEVARSSPTQNPCLLKNCQNLKLLKVKTHLTQAGPTIRNGSDPHFIRRLDPPKLRAHEKASF